MVIDGSVGISSCDEDERNPLINEDGTRNCFVHRQSVAWHNEFCGPDTVASIFKKDAVGTRNEEQQEIVLAVITNNNNNNKIIILIIIGKRNNNI